MLIRKKNTLTVRREMKRNEVYIKINLSLVSAGPTVSVSEMANDCGPRWEAKKLTVVAVTVVWQPPSPPPPPLQTRSNSLGKMVKQTEICQHQADFDCHFHQPYLPPSSPVGAICHFVRLHVHRETARVDTDEDNRAVGFGSAEYFHAFFPFAYPSSPAGKMMVMRIYIAAKLFASLRSAESVGVFRAAKPPAQQEQFAKSFVSVDLI